ncbi:MAG: hypothetical protein K2M14_04975, partial [Muribaculaceae bacterium]|nr:hypothetical protein [Muribaculaceae bacterium]
MLSYIQAALLAAAWSLLLLCRYPSLPAPALSFLSYYSYIGYDSFFSLELLRASNCSAFRVSSAAKLLCCAPKLRRRCFTAFPRCLVSGFSYLSYFSNDSNF